MPGGDRPPLGSPSNASPQRDSSPKGAPEPRPHPSHRPGDRVGAVHHLAARARRLLHRLPLVRLARLLGRLQGRARSEGRAGVDLHRHLLRPLLGEPLDRRPHRAALPSRRARRRSSSSATTSSSGDAPGWSASSCRCSSASSRASGSSSQWNDWILFTHRVDFGQKDPLVPHRRRLLRLQAAVPAVPRGLAVRCGGHRPHHHRRRPLPERRHPGADARPAGHAAGQGPPLGAARGCSRW